jgi:fatty-acyl-CoA synthase
MRKAVDVAQQTDWAEVTTLGDLIVRGAARYPDHLAIAFPDDRRTYAELLDGSVRAAKGLRGLGVGPGDHVGILMANCVAYVEMMLGTAMLGAVAVLINARYRGPELAYVVENADVAVLVTSDIVADHVDHVERVREAFPRLGDAVDPGAPSPGALSLEEAPGLRSVVVLSDVDFPGCLNRTDLERAAADVSDAQIRWLRRQVPLRSPAMMMYTSGTTAHPKGCLMTHEMVVRNCSAAGRQRFELDPTDRFWDPLPLFHMSAILPLVGCLDAGAAYLGMTHFDPSAALQQMVGEEATLAFPTFPLITQALVNHPDYPKTDLSRIRAVCNIAPPDNLRKLQEMWPHAIQFTAYGCTEIGGVACFNELTDTLEQRVNTSGRPFEGIQIRITDPETGQEVPTGEKGEICARGYSLFEGYYKDPERTAETVEPDGWFHTGDIGKVDADGRVSYLGRLKDMLKVGGENVAAAEIEGVLQDHPSVAIAQVVGIPDERYAEVPAAFVELKPGKEATAEELIEHCRGKMASFKLPRLVRTVTEWPMSATKIQKYRLREQLVDELGLQD